MTDENTNIIDINKLTGGTRKAKLPTKKQVVNEYKAQVDALTEKIQQLEEIMGMFLESNKRLSTEVSDLKEALSGSMDAVAIKLTAAFKLLHDKGTTEEEITGAVIEAAEQMKLMKQEMAKQKMGIVDVDREVKTGDTVVVDFEGKVDGQLFEGGAGRGMWMVVGAGRLLPDFENGLVGMKKDETKVVKVAFPENYHNEALKGKTAEFTVTCKQVMEPAPKVENPA